jgi:Cu(I)/Ag(I) efflux system membrane protein CusA/SilA
VICVWCFDANGEGEVVGGIVVMRYGENADKVIQAVKEKKEVQKVEGVTFKTSYDEVIDRKAIESVKGTLIEEMIVVSIIVYYSFSLAKCIDYPDTITNFGSDRIHFFAGFWNFFQYYVTYRNCFGDRCVDDGIVMVENAYRSISEGKKKWILINNRTMKIYLKDI